MGLQHIKRNSGLRTPVCEIEFVNSIVNSRMGMHVSRTRRALTDLVSLHAANQVATRRVNVLISLDVPDRTLSLVGSGRVVSQFHYTDPTRPDPRTAWISDKSADFVWS